MIFRSAPFNAHPKTLKTKTFIESVSIAKESPWDKRRKNKLYIFFGPIHVCITFWEMANAVREQLRRRTRPNLEIILREHDNLFERIKFFRYNIFLTGCDALTFVDKSFSLVVHHHVPVTYDVPTAKAREEI